MFTMPDLSKAYLLSDAKTRSINAENPKGEKGAGGNYTNHLGLARKGRPCIDLPANSETVIAEIEGSGVIQHMWFTVPANAGDEDAKFVLRYLTIKLYWDNEENPSVNVPFGDFFCNAFGQTKNINSMPILSNPTGGFNCYFPMPFLKKAKIVIENTLSVNVGAFFYQITYALEDINETEIAYFHACWNRTNTVIKGVDHVLVEGIKGKGQYVGSYIAIAALQRNWWGEGEIKFYIDDDNEFPTICGTGTEDYVGGAWCFAGHDTGKPASYNTPYLGYVYYEDSAKIDPWYGHNVGLHGMYRFHLLDPIRFENNLKVTIQDIGHNGRATYERDDDICSVAYWYQTEPHNALSSLPDNDAKRPR